MRDRNSTPRAGDWPEPKLFRKSIRREFALYIGAMVTVLMTVTGYVITERYVASATEAVVDLLATQARSYSRLAGKHMLSTNGPDALMLSTVCQKLAGDNPDIFWAGITGKDSVFVAHTDVKQVLGRKRIPPVISSRVQDAVQSDEILEIQSDTIVIRTPIIENDIELGVLVASASTRQVKEARRDSIVAVVTITVAVFLLGLPLTTILMHRKLRPLALIATHLKSADPGNVSLSIPIQARNEFGYLAATLNVMGEKVAEAQRQLVERERMTRELEIAREIQAKILPQSLPADSRLDIACVYRSAMEVGGDYYDFIQFDDDQMGFLVADVAGKSLPGMLVMLMTRDIIKDVTRRQSAPGEVLRATNAELARNVRQGMFVTLFYGLLDLKTGVLRYASAGHNPLIVMSEAGATQLLKTKGYPLGMMPPNLFDQRLEEARMELAPHQWLIQYTDGVNEAHNQDSQEYGMERFSAVLRAGVEMTASQLTESSMGDLQAFVGDAPQYDDITLMALKWQGHTIGCRKPGITSSEVRSAG